MKPCEHCGTPFYPQRPHGRYCQPSCAKAVLYKKNRETGRYKELQYRADLKRLYGMTVEQYNQMLLDQKECCKICLKPAEEHSKNKRLYVDHCHSTGKVRGLLCSHCNTILGMAKDNTDVLQSAINYLKDTAS